MHKGAGLGSDVPQSAIRGGLVIGGVVVEEVSAERVVEVLRRRRCI